MTEHLIQDATLTNIADAIRAKSGNNTAMTPAEMAAAIAGLNGVTCGTEDLVDGVSTMTPGMMYVMYESTITFYIQDIYSDAYHTCTALPGMTWAEWGASEYKTSDIPIYTAINPVSYDSTWMVCHPNTPNIGEKPTTVIQDGVVYVTN